MCLKGPNFNLRQIRNNNATAIPIILTELNLSYNHLEGEVPTEGVFKNTTALSLEGNWQLCGVVLELHMPLASMRQCYSENWTATLSSLWDCAYLPPWHTAKADLHSAKCLPSVTHGKQLTANNGRQRASLPCATSRAHGKHFAVCNIGPTAK